jgi:hypothetical protein
VGLEPLLEQPEPEPEPEPDPDPDDPPLEFEEEEDSDFDHASWVRSAVDAAGKGKTKVIYHGKRHSSPATPPIPLIKFGLGPHKGDRQRGGKRYSRRRSEWGAQDVTPVEQAVENLEDAGDWEAEVSVPSLPATKLDSLSPRYTPRTRERHTPRQRERHTPRNRDRPSADSAGGVKMQEEHPSAEVEAEPDYPQVGRPLRDRRRSDGALVWRPERPLEPGALAGGVAGADGGARRPSHTPRQRERHTPRSRDWPSADSAGAFDVNRQEEHPSAEVEAQSDYPQVGRPMRDRRRSDGALVWRPERPLESGALARGVAGADGGGGRAGRGHKSRGFLTDEPDTTEVEAQSDHPQVGRPMRDRRRLGGASVWRPERALEPGALAGGVAGVDGGGGRPSRGRKSRGFLTDEDDT